jgi:ABC-2 type transport system permease protein
MATETLTRDATANGSAGSLGTSTRVVAKRAVLRYWRTPQIIVVGTLQGVLFLLIFRYVFGGAIGSGGLSYVNFLVPGFITTGLLFTGMTGSVAVAEDREQGFVDRLRSLPIPRSSVLGGRAIADTAFCAWSVLVMTAVGFAVGFRMHAPWINLLWSFGLLLLFAFSFEWIFILLGEIASNPQAAQGMGLLVVPFTFVSSAFVPVASMPGWLQTIAAHQPVTFMVNAVRTLTQGEIAERVLGHSTSYYVWWSLVWSVILVAVFAPLAIRKFRRG